MAAKCSIPSIDLHDLPNQPSKLLAACEEWGCFRLLNHHEVLPATLMSEMKAVVRSLFDLPLEIKRQNLDVITGSGYMAPTAKNPLYEAFGLYDMASRRDVDNFCSQLDASPHQRSLSLSVDFTVTTVDFQDQSTASIIHYYMWMTRNGSRWIDFGRSEMLSLIMMLG